jgi:K+-transporting ATPase KdpF subunit
MNSMSFESIVMLVISILVMGYLLYALLMPEKF